MLAFHSASASIGSPLPLNNFPSAPLSESGIQIKTILENREYTPFCIKKFMEEDWKTASYTPLGKLFDLFICRISGMEPPREPSSEMPKSERKRIGLPSIPHSVLFPIIIRKNTSQYTPPQTNETSEAAFSSDTALLAIPIAGALVIAVIACIVFSKGSKTKEETISVSYYGSMDNERRSYGLDEVVTHR